MAVDVIDQVLELFPGQVIYCFHEIVHNKHVVGRFQSRGVQFVESMDQVPPGKIVVFSAHGVSPAIRAQAKARNLTPIDATCPLVTKVHAEAIRYARQGYQILLVGHRGHQEIAGTMGEAPHATQIVERPEDIPHLDIRDPDRLVYLTQTTLSTDDADIVIRALKTAFPNIKAPPSSDICYATTNRQHAVRQIAPRCDLVLVVGSQNSSNSKRLAEIAENVGTRALLVDDANDLDPTCFTTGRETVLLTAGASAPEDLVADICKALLARYGGDIEVVDVMPEEVEFAAPVALRRLMTDQGIDPASRRFKITPPVITRELYGSVPLTVSARTTETTRVPPHPT